MSYHHEALILILSLPILLLIVFAYSMWERQSRSRVRSATEQDQKSKAVGERKGKQIMGEQTKQRKWTRKRIGQKMSV